MAILEVEHINKTFGRTEVLKDISFSLERGQVLSLIGSSGSGKTTLLKILGLIESVTDGALLYKKDEISKLYPSQKKTIDKLHHMFPYENWTERE